MSLLILALLIILLVLIFRNNNKGAVLSKEAVNELVTKAANYKYLQDVFSGNNLPLPNNKHQPFKALTNTANATVNTLTPSAAPASARALQGWGY